MNDKQRRRGSFSIVGPYARVRVVVAIIVFVFAILVIGYRSLSG